MGEGSAAARRARLGDIDRELMRLRHRHDIAMSAFRFEEATALGPAIAALENERQTLAAAIPPAGAADTGVVPTFARPPRLRRRR